MIGVGLYYGSAVRQFRFGVYWRWVGYCHERSPVSPEECRAQGAAFMEIWGLGPFRFWRFLWPEQPMAKAHGFGLFAQVTLRVYEIGLCPLWWRLAFKRDAKRARLDLGPLMLVYTAKGSMVH